MKTTILLTISVLLYATITTTASAEALTPNEIFGYQLKTGHFTTGKSI